MNTSPKYPRTKKHLFLSAMILGFAISLTTAFAEGDVSQPTNVMVKDLTFVRPPIWKWKETPENSNFDVWFTISGENEKTPTDVYIFSFNRNASEIEKWWKPSFPEADQPGNSTEETVTIKGKEIVYLTWRGVYQNPASTAKPKHGCCFVLAVVPAGNSYVQARLFGPEAEVAKNLPVFKAMMEGALKEYEEIILAAKREGKW
jgi:hypothetical protein